MWRLSRHSVLALLGSVGMLVPAPADEVAAWATLRHGRYMALMGYAEAPGGAGDPLGVSFAATRRPSQSNWLASMAGSCDLQKG